MMAKNLKKVSEIKNICLTINSLARGGAENQCILLAQALNPYHNVTLIILNPKEVYQSRLNLLKKENINYKFLDKNPLKRFFQLIHFFRKNNIDFIFSFLPTDTVLSAICGRIAQVSYIFGGIRSSSWPKIKLSILKVAHNYLLNYTIANNYAGQRAVIDFGFTNNIFVIPNGIEIRPLQEKRRDSKIITLISLGRLVVPKRYDIAIQTIAHLKTIIDEGYEIKYKIVGQGPEHMRILNIIEKHDLHKDIEVITDASDMYALLDTADIYLCTSSFEGISNALMEAMNCAMPIVATDVGDNSHLVLDNKNGLLAQVNDFKDLAEKIKYMIEKPNTRAKMGQESYKHLIANFGFKAFQKKYLDVISNVENIGIRAGELNFQKDEDTITN